jgi:glucokinase
MKDRSLWLTVAQARAPFWAGVDLGGTNIKVGLVDDDGRTVAFHTEKTLVERGPEDVCRRMGEGVHKVAELAGVSLSDIPRAGLGTPGPQDLKAGFIIRAGNLPDFDGFNVRDRVSHHAGLPVTFANDATAAGFGEHWIGAAKQLESLVLLTLGTGVGGSIVIGEATIDGANSHASECGHILVDPAPTARM